MVNRVRPLVVFLGGATILFSAGVEHAWARSPTILEDADMCPAQLHVTVAGRHDKVTVRTDFPLDEIAAEAARSGKPVSHRPLGFYLGRVAYRIKWYEERPRIGDCPPVIRIQASLALVDREIEIGRELVADPCLYQRILLHYTKHASADEAAFDRFVETLRTALSDSSLLGSFRSLHRAQDDNDIDKSMRTIIDRALRPLHETRTMFQNSVDTPQQIQLLNSMTCDSGS